MPRGRRKGSRWSDQAKARGLARNAAARTGNLLRGAAAKGGSATWRITAPSGETWTTRGLADWSRANAHVIGGGGAWRTLYYGLKTAGQTPSGWRGWRAEKITEVVR